MKAAVVCALIAHVIAMTSSQPTYDLEQLQSECGCQQSDEKLEITVNSLKNQVAAMNNKIEQLSNEVRQRPVYRDVTLPPGVSTGPTSMSCET